MIIHAITSCVGQEYASYLAKSLPIWLDTLESLTVVSAPDDAHTFAACKPYSNVSNLHIVLTNVFTQYGAHFNKAAALDYAYATSDPRDWALHVDADIIPPVNWRMQLESARIRPGFLYGAVRTNADGQPHGTDKGFWPYGYFQLWHTGDLHSWRWPLFDPWHGHAGSYDADFAELWPRRYWRRLPFILTHHGESRANWFGPDSKANEVGMAKLLDYGLRQYRLDCQKGYDRLPIPEPEKYYWLDCSPLAHKVWVNRTLHLLATQGPFATKAVYSPTPLPDHICLRPDQRCTSVH